MKSREEEQRHYRKKVNKGICLQALLNQSNSSVPASWPLRLFLASWWVTAYVIVMSYTCNLIAFLTIPASPVKLESVQQLANSHHRFVLYCREKLDRFLYNCPYMCMCLYKCTCVQVFIYIVMKRISHLFSHTDCACWITEATYQMPWPLPPTSHSLLLGRRWTWCLRRRRCRTTMPLSASTSLWQAPTPW